jgi:putative membrane protein
VPFSILAIALSVFLGFRNNACYDRWWEARKHWGDLIVQLRAFARECQAVLGPLRQQSLLRRGIGFAHALAGRLRDLDPGLEAWLPPGELATLANRHNVPDGVLHLISQELGECLRAGEISDIVYQGLQQRLLAMTAIQAACERIRSTPPPFAYSLLLHRTAWLFCLLLPFGLAGSLGLMTPLVVTAIAYTFFGLDALGDELEEPFGLLENDLPLNALVRVVEIDLLQALGEKAPEPLLPVGFVLL